MRPAAPYNASAEKPNPRRRPNGYADHQLDRRERPPWPNRPRRQRWATRLGLPAAAITAAAAIAACGGGSSSGGIAHLSSSSTKAKSAVTSTEKPNPLAFAQCMRKHGLPDFPDPTSSGQLQLPSGLTTSSPAFQKAAKVCGYLIGGETAPKPITQTPQMQATALKLARCMRGTACRTSPTARSARPAESTRTPPRSSAPHKSA